MKVHKYSILTILLLCLGTMSWAQAANSYISQTPGKASGKYNLQAEPNLDMPIYPQTRNMIYSTDFAGSLPADWTTNLISGPVNWAWTDTGGDYGGQLNSTTAANGYMILDSDGLGTGSSEEADLISPAIDCSGASGSIYVSVEHLARTFSGADVSILISTDDFATQTELYRWFGAGMNDTNGSNPVLSQFDITAQAIGQSNVKIKFKWIGALEYWWLVDDFMIYDNSGTFDFTMLNPLGTGNVIPAAGTNTYQPDTVLNLTAEPDFGWTFGSWNQGAVADNTKARTTITMNQDQTVQATFIEYPEDSLYRHQGYAGSAVTSIYDPNNVGGSLDYEVADNFAYSGIDEINKVVVYGVMQTNIGGAWVPWTPSDTEPFIVRFYDEAAGVEPDWVNPVSTQNVAGKVFRAGNTGSWTVYKVELDLTAPISLQSGWVSAQIDVSAGAGGWFMSLKSTDGGDNQAYQKGSATPLDHDVMFELWGALTSILPPANQVVTNLAHNSAALGWTEAGTATQWDIEWGASGFTPGAGNLITATTDNPYPLSGLTGSMAYQWYVRSNYGAGEYSPWTGPHSFTTNVTPITNYPFFEGFETGNTDQSTAIDGWTQATGPGYTSKYWKANTATGNNRTPKTGTFNATLQYNGQSCLFRQMELTAGTTYSIELFARQDGTTAANAKLQVKYGDEASITGMTETIIPETGMIGGDYQRFYGVFSPPNTGLYYIGIQGWINGSPYYISLDDITIDELLPNPVFSYSPTDINFGMVMQGEQVGPQNITITNNGGGILNITAADISIFGTNDTDFSFDPENLPAELHPGQPVVIPVYVTAATEGLISATLRIVNSQTRTNYDVDLSANCLPEGIVVIGNGTVNLEIPIKPFYNYSYSQSIFLQSDIAVADQRIEKVYYYWNGAAEATASNGWTIYMGHTALTEFASTTSWIPLANLSQVFQGAVALPATAG